ncbi:MAG: twin-arginine translocation signal domain-containing protein [Myxococcota bacterium]
MNRRELIKGMAAVTAGVAISGAWIGGARALRARQLRAVLDRQLAGIPHSPDLIDRFFREWNEHLPMLPQTPGDEQQFVTRFLMSTDLFLSSRDPAQPLRWVMFYDPYIHPCYNPLVVRA